MFLKIFQLPIKCTIFQLCSIKIDQVEWNLKIFRYFYKYLILFNLFFWLQVEAFLPCFTKKNQHTLIHTHIYSIQLMKVFNKLFSKYENNVILHEFFCIVAITPHMSNYYCVRTSKKLGLQFFARPAKIVWTHLCVFR